MARTQRIPTLDGLRGIAILLILILHFTMYGGSAPVSGFDLAAYRVVMAGWIGVDLFFVLSGFLITGILYDAKGQQGLLSVVLPSPVTTHWTAVLRCARRLSRVCSGALAAPRGVCLSIG
jgi:peptidoglycan/LPS O-acetylase OafA/YrhL